VNRLADNPVVGYFDNSLAAGQNALAEKMQAIVTHFAPGLMDLFDVRDDCPFLEPLLFAWAVDSERLVPLEQILFGYIPDSQKPREIAVWADAEGAVEIPRAGYFHTGIHNRLLTMRRGPDGPVLTEGDAVVAHTYSAPLTPDGLGIEICRHINPLLSQFFADENGSKPDVDPGLKAGRWADMHAATVGKALQIIQACQPNFFSQVQKAVRRIVLYSSRRPYSFATLGAHGIAFLNVPEGADEIFFVEDLAHQCGHVLFSAMTLDPGELLELPPTFPLAKITGEEKETRDLYTTLHGVYTEAWMNLCLDYCCDLAVFSPRQRHELSGRFALILTRFGSDLRSLSYEGVFSEKGTMLVHWFTGIYRDIVSRRREMLSPLNIQNQPYCFRYEEFVSANPVF
jgi:hypothetical protein